MHPAAQVEATQAVRPTPRGSRRPPSHQGGGGADLWYQIALVDATVEQSLISSAGGTRGRECVYTHVSVCVVCVVWLVWKGGGGFWVCSPTVHVPFSGSLMEVCCANIVPELLFALVKIPRR
jgi:hypothetical protein